MITLHTSRTKLAANGETEFFFTLQCSLLCLQDAPHSGNLKTYRTHRKVSELAERPPLQRQTPQPKQLLSLGTHWQGQRVSDAALDLPHRKAPRLALLLPSTSAIFLNSGPAAPWLVSSSYWKLAVRRLMSLCGLACRKRATRCGVWALKQETWWGRAPSASLTTRCSCPARST